MIPQPNQRSSPRSWKAKRLKRKAALPCTVSSLKRGFLLNGGRERRSSRLEKSTRWSRRPQWMNCWSAPWLQKTVETIAVCVESRRPPLASTSRVGGGLQGFFTGDAVYNSFIWFWIERNFWYSLVCPVSNHIGMKICAMMSVCTVFMYFILFVLYVFSLIL